jgi:hypothetical protein
MEVQRCRTGSGYSWRLPAVVCMAIAGLMASPSDAAFIEGDGVPEPGEVQLIMILNQVEMIGASLATPMLLAGNQVDIEGFVIESPSGSLIADPDGLDPLFTLTENTPIRIAGAASPPVAFAMDEIPMGFGFTPDFIGIPDVSFTYQPAGGDPIQGAIYLFIPEPTYVLPLVLGAMMIRIRRRGTHAA